MSQLGLTSRSCTPEGLSLVLSLVSCQMEKIHTFRLGYNLMWRFWHPKNLESSPHLGVSQPYETTAQEAGEVSPTDLRSSVGT